MCYIDIRCLISVRSHLEKYHFVLKRILHSCVGISRIYKNYHNDVYNL